VQDFIGVWNLVGTPKDGTKKGDWKEKVSWGWKFKGDDAWLVADFGEGKGKYFTAGELRFDPAKKKYVLTMTAADKTEQVYEGELKAGELKAERKDAKTGDVYRVTLNTAAEGVRFQVRLAKQDGGKGAFSDVFFMNGDKEGEKLAGGGGPKKPECIVSGGAASMAVSYGGKTYYVCCGGCRDEFNANPEKYIKAKMK
jgi:YHS domain-containing protein